MKDRIRSGYFLIWTLYLITTQRQFRSYLTILTSEAIANYAQNILFVAICFLLLADIVCLHLRNAARDQRYDMRVIGANVLRYFGRCNPENIILYGFVTFLFMMLTGNKNYFLLLPFFIIGAEYSFDEWIKPAFFVVGLELVIQIGMVWMGYAEDNVTSMYYGECHTLGYGNPNILGQVFLFLLLIGWYLYIDNNTLSYVIGILAAVSVFLIAGCRTASLILLLLPVLFSIFSASGRNSIKRRMDPLLRCFPLFCAALSLCMGFLLAPFDGRMDSNFICRFVELPYGLSDFGLSFFPRELTAPDRVYAFDNYYIWLLVSRGILLFIAFLILNTRMAHMVARLKDSKVAVLFICVMLYQIMEKNTFTPIHYFLYYFLFANKRPDDESQGKRNYYVCGDWVGARPMGVHRYEMNLLRHSDALLRDRQDISVSFVIPKDAHFEEAFDAISICRTGYVGKPDSLVRKILSRLWKRFVFPTFVISHNGTGVDLTLSFPDLLTGVYALHDCIIENYYSKGTKDGGYANRYMKNVRRITANKANRIITVSGFSKKEIAAYYHIDPDTISVIGNGWEHIRDIEEDLRVFDRLNITKETSYCFSLGSKNEHKNIEWIIRTARKNPEYRFIISGHAFGSYDQMGDVGDNVMLTPYLTDGEIKALMKYCNAFMQPSFVEGFGIPPLEALSLERPIIISDIEVFREIYGDAAHYIDPFGDGCLVEDILKQPTASPDAVLKKHSWSNAARAFVCVLSE